MKLTKAEKQKIRSVLVKARKLISKPERWCKFSLAYDASGNTIYPTCRGAVKWCSIGAIRKVSKSYAVPECNFIARLWRCSSIAVFNDSHTHRQVLAKFDSAIRKLS